MVNPDLNLMIRDVARVGQGTMPGEIDRTTMQRYVSITANVEGEVLAQFVLDVDGRPEMSTFKVLKSTHPMFTDAVEASLPNMKFSPALVGGLAVRQLIQMPFQFSLSKQP